MAELGGAELFNARQGERLVKALLDLAARPRPDPEVIPTKGGGRERIVVDEFANVLSVFDKALAATIQHMKEQEAGKKTSLRNERIAELWRIASVAVQPYDNELSSACLMKGNGWIDAKVWKRARSQGLKIGIAEMEKARMALSQMRRTDVPKWFPVAGVIFAGVTVLFLMYVFINGIPVEPPQRLVFNVLIAFCVAASGTFLTGTAAANGQIPFFQNSPVKFSAYGGIATFIVVLMIVSLL